LKTTEEIYAELLENYAGRAGFTPADDCDLAIRLYAAAAEIQALLVQADWVLDQSFPQTAEGTYLDAHAQLRDLSRAEASAAAGILRFSAGSAGTSDVTIGSGTVCMTADEVRFETTADAVLSAGSLSTDVPARAVTAGKNGNVNAGTIAVMTVCPTGITAVTNPAAFTGGTDAEDDESLRARILDSYRRLPNGANAAYYEEIAVGHSGVAAAKAIGRARGIGTVDVYLAAPGGAPDAQTIAAVAADLAAKREIAVDVEVKSPTVSAVNVSTEISVDGGSSFSAVRTAVENAVASFFTGKLLGCGVTMAALQSTVYGVEGVKNCHLLSPAADIAADAAVLPVLGTLTVTQIVEA